MGKSKVGLALKVLAIAVILISLFVAASSYVARKETQYENDLRDARERVRRSEAVVDSLRRKSDSVDLLIDSLETVAEYHRLNSVDARKRLASLLGDLANAKTSMKYEGPDSSLASDALRAFRQRSN